MATPCSLLRLSDLGVSRVFARLSDDEIGRYNTADAALHEKLENGDDALLLLTRGHIRNRVRRKGLFPAGDDTWDDNVQWSPDGKRVMRYTETETETFAIRSMVRQCTTCAGRYYMSPTGDARVLCRRIPETHDYVCELYVGVEATPRVTIDIGRRRTTIAWSPSGDHLMLFFALDCRCSIYRLSDEAKIIIGTYSSAVIKWSACENAFIAPNMNGSIVKRIEWKIVDWREPVRGEQLFLDADDVAWSHDGRYFAWAETETGNVSMCSADFSDFDQPVLFCGKFRDGKFSCISWSTDGNYMSAYDTKHACVFVWNIETRTLLHAVHEERWQRNKWLKLTWIGDTLYILSSNNREFLMTFFRTDDPLLKTVVDAAGLCVYEAAISPAHTHVMLQARGSPKHVYLVDLRD